MTYLPQARVFGAAASLRFILQSFEASQLHEYVTSWLVDVPLLAPLFEGIPLYTFDFVLLDVCH